MKTFLKYILLPLVILIAIAVLLCFLGPKNLNTNESIEIEAPPATIYNLVNSLQRSENWSTWFLNDTSLTTTYNDIYRGVGASSSWVSRTNENYAGKQRIIDVEKNKRVKSELEFKGWNGSSISEFTIDPDGSSTHVTWTFEGEDLPFVWRGMSLVMGMKGDMSKNYKESLQNIKKIAEERATQKLYNGVTISEKVLPEKHFVMQRQEVNKSNVLQFYSATLASLFTKMQKSGIEMKGSPCSFYYRWEHDENTTEMAVALPTAQPIALAGTSSVTIEEQNAIVVDYFGEYDGLGNVHEAIDEYLLDQGYFHNPPAIEEYVTGQSDSSDPSEWQTKVIYFYTN